MGSGSQRGTRMGMGREMEEKVLREVKLEVWPLLGFYLTESLFFLCVVGDLGKKESVRNECNLIQGFKLAPALEIL